MFETINKLFLLVEKRFYKKFLLIQLLIIVSGIIEVVSFFSILPFINLITNPDILNSGIGLDLYNFSGHKTHENFIFNVGIMILLALIISSLSSILRVWYTTYFANEVGFRIGDNIFFHYLSRDYEFYISNNTSYLTKQITVEAIRVKNIMKAIMQVNSNIFMVIIIIIGMIIYDAKLTFTLIILIGMVYFLLHTKVGNLLLNNGRIISLVSKDRFKIITNGLGSVRDIIMSDSSNYFNLKIKKTSQNLTYATTINQVIAQVPGRVFQALIIGSLILVILYHSRRYDSIDSFVITLTAFIMAGYKLMPMFQSIYESIASIKSNFPAIEAILSDFSAGDKNITFKKNFKKNAAISGDIQINNLSYTYHGNKIPTINNVNVIIKKGHKIGIMGESGSGKSTLINIIISLIYPTKGELVVGGKPVNRNNAPSWRRNVGVISQDIYLVDGTISENIAFGKTKDEIDYSKVKECIKRANLIDYISSLPQGLDTEVGERGVQLSGGQKQRIGIARSFYHDAEYLIMDEATSSLDNVTEQKIIKDVVGSKNKCTVIMVAHRIHTLKNCDSIYIMDKGLIIDSGTYDQLRLNSAYFKKMINSN